MTVEELREKGINCYPDNEGGLWYWDEEDRCTQTVEEDEE